MTRHDIMTSKSFFIVNINCLILPLALSFYNRESPQRSILQDYSTRTKDEAESVHIFLYNDAYNVGLLHIILSSVEMRSLQNNRDNRDDEGGFQMKNIGK